MTRIHVAAVPVAGQMPPWVWLWLALLAFALYCLGAVPLVGVPSVALLVYGLSSEAVWR